MGTDVPKQYLPLAGKRVIEHTLERLGGHPRVSGIVVAVAENDLWWEQVTVTATPRPRRAPGGPERCHSVLNGLAKLAERANEDDWVLVHDAARPCVRGEDISLLVDGLSTHAVGGLLGLRVRDTMKRTDAHGDVVETVSREGLWHALTPQMFRLGALRRALQRAMADGRLVTDEAQAMELAGAVPRMVEGQPDNVKITRPEDMALAELYIRRQREEPVRSGRGMGD